MLKVMSKMGISTIASYVGAQVFESFGLAQDVVDEYFGAPGSLGLVSTCSRAKVWARHARAYPVVPSALAHCRLDVGGEYLWRREGELHLFNPETVFLLQHTLPGNVATEGRFLGIQRETRLVAQSRRLHTPPGSVRISRRRLRLPIPFWGCRWSRYSSGCAASRPVPCRMVRSRLSPTRALAIAMNRIGARSNCGEGRRGPLLRLPPADSERRYAVHPRSSKPASGRLGVTSHYLVIGVDEGTTSDTEPARCQLA